MNFIWYIIIGIVSGFLAGKIMNGGGFGLLINLLVGIIGGVLGGWVFGLLGIATAGILGSGPVDFSPSVHGDACVFGSVGILGGGPIATFVARCQQRPGHDADYKSRILQRYLRSLVKRVGRPVY